MQRQSQRGRLSEENRSTECRHVIQIRAPIDLCCTAILAMKPKLEQRQLRSEAEPRIAESGQHVNKIVIVRCAQEQPVDFSARATPGMHKRAEPETGASQSQNSSSARAIGRRRLSRQRWRKNLNAFDEAAKLLRGLNDCGLGT